ncbi:endonuclease/exonuclease/phosphatase family protein [Actinoplanes sp. DH11]|uniref:endonuclease/exonuclease/phosphatase family protein n=1 Tax=Actinoplanes sp. DH11 TaxID=2857011 RepID=UPI001E348534|nr:endonuclease/exonuclease/phosphatase family protein [Actinoplanes sp. DH11]
MSIIVAALLLFHGAVPSAGLLETFLPWLGLAIPLLLARAWFRSLRALVVALLPLVVWLGLFGDRLLPASTGPHQLVAVQHNVSDENPDPAGTARALLRSGPDLIGLEEIVPAALPAYEEALRATHPHSAVHGTVALWSRHPLVESGPLDIRPRSLGADWNRGLRAVARTPHGDIAVYVVHLPSVRLNPAGFDTARRDESGRKLAAALAAEPLHRILLLGDLNSTVDDRVLTPVLSRLNTSDSRFAFSWPAATPLARIDHVMAGGMTVLDVRTLPRTGSDHLPVAAHLHVP